MEGGDSEFANFTLPTLKAFLEARSHNVSVARAIGYPKMHFFLFFFFFFFLIKSRCSDQPKNDEKTLFSHFSPPFPCNLCNSKFNFHRYTQREAMPTQKPARR